MNTMKTISIATLLALGVATGASAQQMSPHSRYDENGVIRPQFASPPPQERTNDHRPGFGGPSNPAPPAARYDRPGYDRQGYERQGFDRRGPDRAWQRGDRLPPEYRGRQYVVDDWRGHRLQRPPRGYHWVQHGNDYALAAIATGIIASVLLNH